MGTANLYQEVILDHNKKPRNWGKLSNPTHQAEGFNPLCGDRINLMLEVSHESIVDIAVEGDSCAICKASASMMSATVKGKTVGLAECLVAEFREMVVGDKKKGVSNKLGRLKVFQGIRELPSRVKCAVLPWHTLFAAVNSQNNVTTEGSDDPTS